MLPEWQVPKTQAEKDASKLERWQYFQELFRMQGGFSMCREFCRHQGVAARARIL